MNKLVILAFTTLIIGACAHGGDHGGKEHGGKEHGDKLHKKEHGGKEKGEKEHGGKEKDGKEHGGAEKCAEGKKGDECRAKHTKKKGASLMTEIPMRKVSVKEIKSSLIKYISENSNDDGVYNYQDLDRNNNTLALKFVKIHDPVRVMEKKGQYFACTDFEIVGQEGKLHDLDFWMVPSENGLSIVRTKVHKDPVWMSKKWEKVPRYTFKGENIVTIKQ